MSPTARTRTARLPIALWIGLGLAVGMTTWIVIASTQPPGLESLGLLNRCLVRVSLPFFVLAFAASSLAQLFPSSWTRRILRERRGLGLAWAMVHLTHGAAIIRLALEDGAPVFSETTIIFGGFGFVVTVAMVVTSNEAVKRRMGGRAWTRLHRMGIRYIMFIYLVSYGGGAAETGELRPTVVFSLLSLVVMLRVAAGLRSRRVAKARATVPVGS